MPGYCTTCGARRADADKVCAHCEAAFKDTDETRSADGPPGHGTSWFVGITMVLAVIVTGGILGADALIGRATAAATDSQLYNRLTPDGYITSGPIEPAEETPSEPWVPPATEDETSEPTPSETTETTEVSELGNELITVAPEVAQEPSAVAVVQLLTSYFTAINNHDYDSYQLLLTRAARATQTRKQFTDGFRSTVDSEITLLGLSTATDGRLLAQVSFVSTQNAEDGPDGQTCTRWTVGKFLEGRSPNFLIGKALSGHAGREPC